jgi:hypothetical protein
MSEEQHAGGFDDIAELLGTALQECLDQGMVLPFICVAAAVNGSISAVRFTQGADGLDATHLAEHHDRGAFVLPINIMFMDQEGKAVRLGISRGGEVTHH